MRVPLGIGAYERAYAGEPQIRLENRFVERNPTNLREHIALLSRCGTVDLASFAGGNIRGNFSLNGLFSSDLFVVSGANLWRYNSAGTKTQINGIINGTGEPQIGWMKGIGYEYLFISDGLLLQFYNGGSHANGTLTLTPSAPPDIKNTYIIDIGGVYHTWNANVNADPAADGTAAHPWIALLGATDSDSLANMAKLINFNGTRGVDFSSTLGGPNAAYSASSTATTLVITSTSVYADGNTITTSVVSGAQVAWGGATLTGGGVHALSGVAVPDGVGIQSLTSVSGYVLASVANSQKFFWLNPGEVIIDPLNFAEKESHPDPIVDMLTASDQAIIMGEGSTENWYATGDLLAPFAPQEGRTYQQGVIEGTAAEVKADDSVILVGSDGVVYQIGYGGSGMERISNHGIEERIRTQLRREQGI